MEGEEYLKKEEAVFKLGGVVTAFANFYIFVFSFSLAFILFFIRLF